MALCAVIFIVARLALILATQGKEPTKPGDSLLAHRVATLESMVREQQVFMMRQERIVQKMLSEKEQWSREKQSLLRDVADLRRDVATLQSSTCFHSRGSHSRPLPSQNETADNKRDVNKPPEHALLGRSDDSDPLQAVVAQLTEKINEVGAGLQTLRNEVRVDLSEASTSVFVHWGSSTCPGSSALVYTGVVGGSHYDSPGAAVDFLCLPIADVVLVDSSTTYSAHLFGGEYETYDTHMNTDPLCAVCRSPRPASIMVPAINQCPSGWTLEYGGYLMTGYPDHKAASQFVCVDSKMAERLGSEQDFNGKLLYYTVTNCGSLPCPPYSDGKKVTCVVCSK